MVLEAVMICLDNSEWTRNGDYAPTRFQAQQEACVHVAGAKLQSNPETVVGVMSMAGKRIEVHLNFTQEAGTVIRSLDDINLGGKCNFVGALKTAQLALKNRQNKNQRQRVIMFVGSPVTTSKEEFEKLGKVLKKNNVAVDVISFGAEAVDNVDKLESLIKAVDASGNSHLVNVPNGPHQLSDMLTSSPIFSDSGAGAAPAAAAAPGAGAAAGAGAAFGGVDPNMDPELAMVLRMSLEEEKARQQAAMAAAGVQPAAATGAGSGGAAQAPAAGGVAAMDEDEDALLQQAIAMSMAQDEQERAAAAAAAAPATPAKPASAAPSTPAAAASKDVAMKPADEPDISSALADPDFVNNLLSDVGIQRDELQLADILGSSTTEDEKKKQEDAKKKGDKDKPK